MKPSDGPIGLFDSGVGGLTVARALARKLPNERLLYFGDTAHLPYGEKSPEAIRSYALGISKHLKDQGAKAIVVACNSASAVALEVLKEELNIPVYNVIDPVVYYLQRKHAKNIGIWGTRATVASGIYPRKLAIVLPNADVQPLATPLLVPVIEENLLSGAVTDAVVSLYLNDVRMRNVEHLVLACTHYPLISSQIAKQLQKKVNLLRIPTIVANSIAKQLEEAQLLRSTPATQAHHFAVSDYTDSFAKVSRIFFGKGINLVEENIWS
ncbi:MAG: glutamate racemase [Schleiferiaceae bacterium]|nr:glutamate racemase [Schleiferiaceae bacterium]